MLVCLVLSAGDPGQYGGMSWHDGGHADSSAPDYSVRDCPLSIDEPRLQHDPLPSQR